MPAEKKTKPRRAMGKHGEVAFALVRRSKVTGDRYLRHGPEESAFYHQLMSQAAKGKPA